jgi:N-ethylmaleimide reductase
MSEVIRKASGIPVITNGGIADGAEAEACLKSGGGDMVAIGRQSFTRPDWPYMVHSGAAYNWLPFDRKYVIRPSLDYGIAYPAALEDPNWTTKFN